MYDSIVCSAQWSTGGVTCTDNLGELGLKRVWVSVSLNRLWYEAVCQLWEWHRQHIVDAELETLESLQNNREYWEQPGVREMDAILESDWANEALILDRRARAAESMAAQSHATGLAPPASPSAASAEGGAASSSSASCTAVILKASQADITKVLEETMKGTLKSPTG